MMNLGHDGNKSTVRIIKTYFIHSHLVVNQLDLIHLIISDIFSQQRDLNNCTCHSPYFRGFTNHKVPARYN